MNNKVIQLATRTQQTPGVWVEAVSWQTAKSAFQASKPALFNIIEQWAPGSEYQLLRATYSYGAPIIRDGVLYFGGDRQKSYPIHSKHVPHEYRAALDYSPVPLGLITEGGSEVYFEDDERLATLSFFKPGIILGLWESLENPNLSHHPQSIWKVNSGARSLIMLPAIADAAAHERLKRRYGIRTYGPKRFRDQGRVFAELANKPKFPETWSHEIYFFSKRWLQPCDSSGWQAFHRYLLQEAWEFSAYQRNQITHNMIWDQFVSYLIKQGVNPDYYLLNTLRYLIGIGAGVLPGFSPNQQQNLAGPLTNLRAVYHQDYKLEYDPTIMTPDYLSKQGCQSVYYSLQFPTAFTPNVTTRKQSTYIKAIKTLKTLWEYFIDMAFEEADKFENTYFKSVIDNVNMDFFHNEAYEGDYIRHPEVLLEEDRQLKACFSSKDTKLPFAAHSLFFKGCVRIYLINSQ